MVLLAALVAFHDLGPGSAVASSTRRPTARRANCLRPRPALARTTQRLAPVGCPSRPPVVPHRPHCQQPRPPTTPPKRECQDRSLTKAGSSSSLTISQHPRSQL